MSELILNLGVKDLPYVEAPRRAPKARKGKQRPRKTGAARGAHSTTGEVAEYLETKYHVMEVFYERHEEEIGGMLMQGMIEVLESVLSGAPPIGLDPFANAMKDIEAKFKDWLSTGEAEQSGIAGTPTKAARRRRSLRFKSKTSDRYRPSFIDTGLNEGSFTAFMEEKAGALFGN